MDDRFGTDESTQTIDDFDDDVVALPRVEVWRAQRPRTASELVKEVVAAHLEVEATDIFPAQNFDRDLGITRLGLVLIGLDLEDLERVSLPFEEFTNVFTVDDLIRKLESAMHTSRSSVSVLGRFG